MIAGLEEVTSGEISIAGKRVNELAPKDRDIAMVFQSYALYPHMNVANNMSYSLRLRKQAKDKIASAVNGAAAKLGLDPLLERRPKALSGGQRQRVAMGRAIVREPKAFLFDEPLSNLDARLREQMRAEIKKLHADLKATSIYVTHDQIEAMTLADRIVAMHGGVVQQVGTPLELYDRPANLFVAGFIGSPGMNFLEGAYQAERGQGSIRLAGNTTMPLDEPARLENDMPVTLGVRPEHVSLVETGGMEATVDLVEPTGFGIILHLSLHGLPFKVFTLNRDALTAGPKVRVDFPAKHLHLFDQAGNRIG
jgi:multiple sugar transport system ATP-binding protein